MTIVRVGATKKYSEGWASAFGKAKRSSEPLVATKKPSAKPAKALKTATAKASTKRKSAAKKGKK